MKIIDINLKCIKADEGKVLTNGEAFSSVGGEVYLGINDKAENWHEITEAEYEKIIKRDERPAVEIDKIDSNLDEALDLDDPSDEF